MTARICTLRDGLCWEIGRSRERIALDSSPEGEVSLNTIDPRVGMVVVWDTFGAEEATAIVRAVVRMDGVDAFLLLEDDEGYPWVVVRLDARVVSLDEGDYRC